MPLPLELRVLSDARLSSCAEVVPLPLPWPLALCALLPRLCLRLFMIAKYARTMRGEGEASATEEEEEEVVVVVGEGQDGWVVSERESGRHG